ncbi:MAG: hypothetical protein LBC17_03945 [Lactobacillaceae bacterium]|jgi:uncharacterized protein YxjI|nr:hypothetical protein [Lactobacillaceae bacterium]
MTIYLLSKNKTQRNIDFKVFDENFNPVFRVLGNTGRKNDVLFVYDLSNTELARIRQISVGLIPRFQLLHDDNYVASFSFNFGPLSDLIYISHLNWIITGNIINGNYRIRYGSKKILSVSEIQLPEGDFNRLDVVLDNQASVHVAIVALLNNWIYLKSKSWMKYFNPKFKVKYKLATKTLNNNK